ncbi:MAG TPA: molybdenum ABC transporter ATP-binding protein [Steroidobacteraceae bacterium]|nr:molybdenum ABC transporter ATP-binding protein [Steroidobacteraceae bacterium]
MLEVDVQLARGNFTLAAKFAAGTPGVIALFGRSGCGKTTLVNLIAGLLRADHGRMALDGEVWFEAARAIDLPAERRRIGYVFQDARLFPHYSVRGNLLYGAPRGGARGFDDVVQLLGLAPLLTRRPAGLSGGEKQRVALGRALLASPRLLLLDEPLAALDASRRDEVLPYLERLRDHYSIPMVYVSHQLDEVLRLATQVVVLDGGRVVAAGDLAAVSLHPALRAIVGSDAVGAILDGTIAAIDDGANLASVTFGTGGILKVGAGGLASGQRVRLQLLARDLILALEEPHGISVRNHLRGSVRAIAADGGGADLIEVDVAGATLLARVTAAATRELQLAPGLPLWVLVKAVSVSPHAMGTVEPRER